MRGRNGRRGALSVAVLVMLILLTGAGTASGPRHPPRAALFFGDSLFVGVGARPQRPVQVRTVADRMGWHAVLDARGGTGFTTGGRHRSYLQRMRQDGYLRAPYPVIVLEGGTNDARHGQLARLHAAALRTVDYLRSRQPRARIVLVGPYAPAGVDVERYAVADRVLAQVATERGLQYVSQLHYSAVTDPGFLSRDGYHPSDAGYAQMGKDLAAALKE